jgi:hypothetical protein
MVCVPIIGGAEKCDDFKPYDPDVVPVSPFSRSCPVRFPDGSLFDACDRRCQSYTMN